MNKDEQDFNTLKLKMLNWANQFNIFCLLDNNNYCFELPKFECLLAIAGTNTFTFEKNNNFIEFQKFYANNPTWLFGHFGYNATGKAYTKREHTQFGDGLFFEPSIILKLSNNNISIIKSNIDSDIILAEILATSEIKSKKKSLNIIHTLTKDEYIEKVKLLQLHIQRGDCYEINFCQHFFAENVNISPIETYLNLCELSPAPFAALYKHYHNYCLCASPERFLQKKGALLTSQPIKGTSSRHLDKKIDENNKKYLIESEKEKSENVMVVDIVRNDLSIVCKKGSVKVKELFGIYSFPQVHQMISTIQGELAADKTNIDALEACYPMASMTGAPKQKVMELIEKHESTQRGLFSGSIGYITPDGDFDFNVVIRSVFYNQIENKISFFAGSGITYNSIAENEYEECLSKAAALIKVLEGG